MDLWDKFAPSNTPLAISQDFAADVCHVCNVAFDYIDGGKLCPQCYQFQDFSFNEVVSNTQTNIIIRDGQLHSCTHAYNRSDALMKTYDRIFVNSNFRPASKLIENAISLINSAQKFTSHNRGQSLNEMMAGAISIAAGMESHVMNETQLSRVFRTQAGISQGRNRVFTAIVKGQLLGLDTEGATKHVRFLEDDKSISNLIRRAMDEVGLNSADRSLYMFIKALVMIERLYRHVDQQIVNTKISASIFYYFSCAPAHKVTRPLTIKEVAQRLNISQESIRKYYLKLCYAGDTIQLIADCLKIQINVIRK